MFNGHMDTSYSGREPWLRDVPGFQPRGVRPGRAAVRPRHLEHEGGARLLRRGRAGAARRRRPAARGRAHRRRLRRDREDAAGRRGRGRVPRLCAGSRYLVSHGGIADMCLLGEPTEGKVVLGHYGALWLRIRVHGDFIHTAFSEGRRDRNAILRQHEVMGAVKEWSAVGGRPGERVPRREGNRQRRRRRGRLRMARLADAASRRPLPRCARPSDEADGGGAARGPRHGAGTGGALSRLRRRGRGVRHAHSAEIEEGHELVAAIDGAQEEVFGEAPGRDVTRWFSDASVITRYGIPTVNYGTSTGLMDVERGENLEIDGLVPTAEVYARVAMRVCGVA